MSDLPTGTVTFLFTDIEGSTKRWEQYPQQMKYALARHDAILREAIESQGGFVFETVGDAFCAAFSSAPDALRAALSAQHALKTQAWPEQIGEVRVRMALHTAATEPEEGAYPHTYSYSSQHLNRIARLLSSGHGGQVLLSLSTEELVRDALPEGVELQDMGEHRLKDLIRPQHIFQVLAPGAPWQLPSEFPPLKTLDTHPNNLPVQPTSLIGRARELAEVAALLHRPDVKLLTFTGPGGTGKTRLAVQAAADLLHHFEQGVFFVNLAPISDPNLVTSEIAQTLGVREAAGQEQPLIDTLKEYLREKELLLLLDNFEQVADASLVLPDLLKLAPHLKILVTSRVRLHVYGEYDYLVPPLSLPDRRQLPPLEHLSQYEAVRLFIERAQAAKSSFSITNENAPAVAEICHRLDGLPLAIELAAARITLLPPQAMLSRLESGLRVLTGGARNLPARQQTLRAAIEWSYELLNEGEKRLFRRLAVFVGGRTLEAIAAVCNGKGETEGELEELGIDVLDGVQSLIDKSLLRQEEGVGGEPRFVMLETIHEYAREKLGESGEAEELRRRHADYFRRLAEEVEPHLTGPQQQEWLDRLEEEHDNFRAALRWARESGNSEDIEVGVRTGGALWRFWFTRGYLSEGREQLSGLLEKSRTKANSAGADGLQPKALEVKRYRAFAVNGAGVLADVQGDYTTSRAMFEESLALRRELGDKNSIASSLNNLGLVTQRQGDYTSARTLYEESLALFRELGNKWGMGNTLGNLATIAYEQGDYTSARSLYDESLALHRETGDKRGIAEGLKSLGNIAQQQGDYASARTLYEGSLALEREIGDKLGIATSVAGLGGVLVGRGQTQRGAAVLGAVEALLESMGAVLDGGDHLLNERAVASARAGLSDEEFQRARQQGWAMSMEQAIEYALQ